MIGCVVVRDAAAGPLDFRAVQARLTAAPRMRAVAEHRPAQLVAFDGLAAGGDRVHVPLPAPTTLALAFAGVIDAARQRATAGSTTILAGAVASTLTPLLQPTHRHDHRTSVRQTRGRRLHDTLGGLGGAWAVIGSPPQASIRARTPGGRRAPGWRCR